MGLLDFLTSTKRPASGTPVLPAQTVREKLLALKQDQEAFDLYREFMHNAPDYPDKVAILQKLAGLARKLDQTAEAQKYEAEIKTLSAASKS